MKLLSIKKIHEGKFLSYYVADYENKEGNIKSYEFISRDKNLTMEKFGKSVPIGVGLATLSTDKSKILLQKEFRLSTNNWVYNFPGGLIDAGENAKEAAKRELKEETGLDLVNIEAVLPAAFVSPATSDEVMQVVICTVQGTIKESIYADEEIQADWYDKNQVKELLNSGALMSVRTQMFLYMWANS